MRRMIGRVVLCGLVLGTPLVAAQAPLAPAEQQTKNMAAALDNFAIAIRTQEQVLASCRQTQTKPTDCAILEDALRQGQQQHRDLCKAHNMPRGQGHCP